MATIQENKVTPEWVDDLYQIEMTDPVMGGADGVANRQAKQLGSRTQWLKKKYENQEDEFNKYKKSVESATELKAGVTKLTSDIVRHKDDGGYAVTPQAVVDYLASQSASVKDVNELRNYESNSLYVNVSGYYASTPGIGGGLFVAAPNDKTSVDNGGTIIVASNGMRWHRLHSGAAANLKSNEWTGAGLIAIGEGAMGQMEKCVSAIAIGDRAQGFSKVSRDNIAIGADSLINVQAETEWYDQSKMAGTRNIGIGGNAGRGITSGFSNVAIGRNAGQGLSTGISNIALGAAAMAGTAPVGLTGDIEVFWPSPTSKTIAIGESVLQYYQGRSAQTAIGGGAARNTKMAEKVTAIGAAAMENLERNRAPNGGDVVWTGTESGTYAQSGKNITLTFPNIHGAQATYWVGIRLTSGTAQTLQNDVVPAQVVSVNGNTLIIQSPKELTATGAAELKYVYSANSTATKNEELTIIGSNAMNKALTAGYSTIIGADAALFGENYLKTTAIGASSLRTGTHISTTAIGYWALTGASSEQCVVIGDSAGYRNVQGNFLTGKITNSIAIGYGARINGDNEIQIGTTGQTLYAPTSVNIRSDGRDKADVKPLMNGLDFVMKLKPMTGYYDRRDSYVDELFKDLAADERAAKVREWWANPIKDGSHKEDRLQHWFIAQDIAALEDEYGRLPMVNKTNDTYTIEYETFIPVLTRAIQEMAARIETLETEMKESKK